MKSKVFKVITPVLAFVFAMAFTSFTFHRYPPIFGYYDNPFIPGIQKVLTDCTLTGGEYCKITIGPFQYQLYATDDLFPGDELKMVDW